MTKKKASDDSEDFIFDEAKPVGEKSLDEDGTIVKTPTAKDEERSPEFDGHLPEDKRPIVCEACDDRGAVPKTIVNGVVTEWKDCAFCYRHELKNEKGEVLKDDKGNPIEVRRLRAMTYDD